MSDPNALTRASKPLLRTMLGAVLREVRRRQGRTLAEVAAAAMVSMQYLSELERGRKEASSEVLAAVCEALGVELSDVLAAVGRAMVTRRVGSVEAVPTTVAPPQARTSTPGTFALAA